MALREILTFPDPRLAEKSLPVVAVDDGIRLLVDDMFETMYKNEGVGLAAPQVGALVRVLVIDCGEREGHGDQGRVALHHVHQRPSWARPISRILLRPGRGPYLRLRVYWRPGVTTGKSGCRGWRKI